jgi:hypothetical protein
MGSEEPGISQPLRIFKAGMVSEEDRRNRIIDEIEESEFENQMFNLAVTYMNEGMALELEELIGNDVQNLERFSVSLDLLGERRVTPHPLTMTITTLEILEPNKPTTLLRNFIVVQPSPIWSTVDLSISIQTGMTSSLTGAEIKGGDDSIELTHRRTPFGESIEISAKDLKPTDTFSLTAMPTSNPLNAPGSLSLITILSLGVGLFVSLMMTKTKRRSALWFEMVLIPVTLVSLYYAAPPLTIGAITAITVTIWIITAVASPTRKGAVMATKVIDYPIIECPACSTPNPITTEQRPFRLPCQGCGRVLKIVE